MAGLPKEFAGEVGLFAFGITGNFAQTNWKGHSEQSEKVAFPKDRSGTKLRLNV
jgi:hypothetical protein